MPGTDRPDTAGPMRRWPASLPSPPVTYPARREVHGTASERPGDTAAISSSGEIQPEISIAYEVALKVLEEMERDLTTSKSETKVRGVCQIEGESFDVELEEGQVHISRRDWSLSGVGPTLLAAELDLISEAKEVASVLLHEPPGNLTPGARALREFVLRFLTTDLP